MILDIPILFDLRSILSDIDLVFLFISIAWHIFSYPFSLSVSLTHTLETTHRFSSPIIVFKLEIIIIVIIKIF